MLNSFVLAVIFTCTNCHSTNSTLCVSVRIVRQFEPYRPCSTVRNTKLPTRPRYCSSSIAGFRLIWPENTLYVLYRHYNDIRSAIGFVPWIFSVPRHPAWSFSLTFPLCLNSAASSPNCTGSSTLPCWTRIWNLRDFWSVDWWWFPCLCVSPDWDRNFRPNFCSDCPIATSYRQRHRTWTICSRFRITCHFWKFAN